MQDYVINIRRRLHEIPEIGFDLDKTLSVVRSELDAMGIPYSENYGKSSIVATLGKPDASLTLAIRADMDALPITEENDAPYKSKTQGQMHACGHDAHTAMALDAARRLKEIEQTLECQVKIIFQSAEEHSVSGAKLMADDGVMDGIDSIVAIHVDPTHETGCVAISEGRQNAISYGFYLEFFGKSVHVARQSEGVDAIRMASTAYNAINIAAENAKRAGDELIFGVGKIEGGKTNNIVCDYCRLFATLRAISEESYLHFDGQMKEILASVARDMGGEARLTPVKFYPLVINDAEVTRRARETLISLVGEEKVLKKQPDMIGEDFAYFARLKPGCMIRLGTKNEKLATAYPLHTTRFNIDESALKIGSDFFVNFVLNNMKG